MVLAERPFIGLQVVRMLHNEMGYHSDLIEKQLAHAVGSEVRRAYDRSQHIDKRTTMMQDWANYLDSLQMGAQVIPFKTA